MWCSVRCRRNRFLPFAGLLVLALLVTIQTGVYRKASFSHSYFESKPAESSPPPKPIYKPTSDLLPPIVDNFPLAASAKSPTDLPPTPQWNAPPEPHVEESTPLFIGFTRNWRLLQQVVVSYITAGWPPSDIYVVENTGTMYSNRDKLLTLQNPFYLDYHRLTSILGINVISTPTLLTFAQLQNFYIHTALDKGWDHYFWGHMDVVVVSDEDYEPEPYKSLYGRAVDAMRETMQPGYGLLATRWFAYDRLALVRTQAFVDVGGWDTMIPFYMGDCDMHERLWMKDFKIHDADAGKVWDVGTSLDDLIILYERGMKSSKKRKRENPPPSPDTSPYQPWSIPPRKSPKYQDLLHTLDEMQNLKNGDASKRNTWQARQQGGQGEPFYRDAQGFETAVRMTMDFGRTVFEEKWGRGPCNLREVGLVEQDAWRVVPDWENPQVQQKAEREKREEEKKKVKAIKEVKEKG